MLFGWFSTSVTFSNDALTGSSSGGAAFQVFVVGGKAKLVKYVGVHVTGSEDVAGF